MLLINGSKSILFAFPKSWVHGDTSKRKTGASREFYLILGFYFNNVHAVFLEIFGYIHTDRQTYIQKVLFYNIEVDCNNIAEDLTLRTKL